MAIDVNTTKLADLVDPQVLADMIAGQLPNAIRFSPLAVVDRTLVGTPGSTITVPAWTYIGDAEDVAEGEAIPIAKLTQTDKQMTIKKAGKGIEITDEAVLSGYGNPLNEAQRQLVLSIANKVDNDAIAELGKATQSHTATDGLTVADLEAAIGLFNDEDDADLVLIASPADAAKLRVDAAQNWLNGTEVGADRLVSGVFGEILGAQVVRSRKLDGEAYLVKRGALRLNLKRDVLVETDRDIIHKTTVVTADQHYGVYLYDESKAVKIVTTGA